MYCANDEFEHSVCARFAPKTKRYYCPKCKEEVTLRCGDIRVPHFAHKNDSKCRGLISNESEWHLNWKSQFTSQLREITIKIGDKTHRADVLADRTVFEFQHSRINEERYFERTNFYLLNKYRLIWLFDMRGKNFIKKSEEAYCFPDNFFSFGSINRQDRQVFLPQNWKNNTLVLLFETSNGIKRIDWASPASFYKGKFMPAFNRVCISDFDFNLVIQNVNNFYKTIKE